VRSLRSGASELVYDTHLKGLPDATTPPRYRCDEGPAAPLQSAISRSGVEYIWWLPRRVHRLLAEFAVLQLLLLAHVVDFIAESLGVSVLALQREV
jgi:hypothetical protein